MRLAWLTACVLAACVANADEIDAASVAAFFDAAYAIERKQFGVAIGSQQAVKHHLADATMKLRFAAPAVYAAAWELSTGAPTASRAVSTAKALASEADDVATAKDGVEAMDLFRRLHHHLVITDLRMPGNQSGLDLVKQIKHERPETLILVITAHGSVETAVEAMRQGAHDYISKPVDIGMLRLLVQNAYEHHRLVDENRQPIRELS